MDIRKRFCFFVSVIVFVIGCNTGQYPPQESPTRVRNTSTATDDSVIFPADKSFQADNGNSSLLFEDETIVRPELDEGEINVHELNPQELSERVQDTPPPDGRKIITSLEITLDGMMFAPPAIVKFDVSGRDDLKKGDVLELYTFDDKKKEWELLGKADVDDEWFAVARILHTSIYTVMDKVVSFNITDTSMPPDAPITLTPSRTPTKTITPSGTAPPSAEISGSLWYDANRNKSIDIGETTGLGGYTVRLGKGSCNSSGFQQTTSNTSGFYNFTNLPAGTYCVSVDIPPICSEYYITTSSSYTIILGNGQSASLNFGYDKPIC